MATTKTITTSFNAGELSPKVYGRVDLEQYYNGCASLKNCIVEPQGGVSKRFGLSYAYDIDNALNFYRTWSGIKLEPFVFNTFERYLVAFTGNGGNIYVFDASPDSDEIKLIDTVPSSILSTQVESLYVIQSQDTMIITHPDIPTKMLVRERSGNSVSFRLKDAPLVNIPTYDFGGGEEPVWSATRGYPATCTLGNGRLWFGGSRDRPQTIWGSRSNNFFDFQVVNPDEILANDSVEITINDTSSNLITSISTASSRGILVYTVGGVFLLNGEGGLITPLNCLISKQAGFGSEFGRTAQMDNSEFYIQLGGGEINSVNYDYARDMFLSNQTSLLSTHLIRNPVEIKSVTASDKYNSNYLFIRNEDGTLALFNRLEAQNVSSWTPLITDGKIISICGVMDQMFCAVIREYKGSDSLPDGKNILLSIERYSENNSYNDASIHVTSPTPEQSWTWHPKYRCFENKTVAALCDGYPVMFEFKKYRISTGYVFDVPFECKDLIFGLPIECEIQTMPYAPNLQSGNARFTQKRVIKAKFDMYESLGFDVEYAGRDYKVSDLKMGFELHSPPVPITEPREVTFLGFSQDASVKIKSKTPTALNLRSLELQVKVKG